ncbi:MAG: AAA family ATPase, partial [Rickettsiaceae bacterium]|nr:AAA family ATPase [Rickettsiaceae bacterium]
VLLFTRPRRFGKTLNMSMFSYFFDLNKKREKSIFADLYIGKEKEICAKYQNQHPVIYISLKDVKAYDYEIMQGMFKTVIFNLCNQLYYLLSSDKLMENQKKIFEDLTYRDYSKIELQDTILFLSQLLYQHHQKKVIILIDEYDTPLQEAYLHTVNKNIPLNSEDSYYAKAVNLLRGIFGSALKDNPCLEKAILTGIARVAQESLFSSLNNIKSYSMLNENYGQYFGFTDDEVKQMLKEVNLENKYDDLKSWYNGYNIGKYAIYNPWSIINCLSESGKFGLHWLNTGSTGLLDWIKSSNSDSLKADLETIISKTSIRRSISEHIVFKDLKDSDNALWSLLFFTGYVNISNVELVSDNFEADLSIPNYEVKLAYISMIKRWMITSLNQYNYEKFLDSLVTGEMGLFKRFLQEYLMKAGSYFDFNQTTPEQVFHLFFLGIIAGLFEKYDIKSNHEMGLGRSDIIIVPRDHNKQSIVMEFKIVEEAKKLKKAAKEAVKQIKLKRYIDGAPTKDKLLIGVAFYGKETEIYSEVIKE